VGEVEHQIAGDLLVGFLDQHHKGFLAQHFFHILVGIRRVSTYLIMTGLTGSGNTRHDAEIGQRS
jgi:hypothetical protein